jgi:hypothetical protein
VPQIGSGTIVVYILFAQSIRVGDGIGGEGRVKGDVMRGIIGGLLG